MPVGGRRASYDAVERAVTVLIRRSRTWSALMAEEVHPGLDRTAYAVLTRLDETGPQRQGDLVEHLGLDKSVVSRHVAALVGSGLLEREDDPHDGRAWLLRASAAGRARLRDARDGRRRLMRDALADWTVDDVSRLAALLDRFTAAMPPTHDQPSDPDPTSRDETTAR
jgi:DNA-binding MarR family transcriptional regulator